MEVHDRHRILMGLRYRTEQVVPVVDPRLLEQALIPVDAAGEIRRLEIRRGEEHDMHSRRGEHPERVVELAGQELVELGCAPPDHVPVHPAVVHVPGAPEGDDDLGLLAPDDLGPRVAPVVTLVGVRVPCAADVGVPSDYPAAEHPCVLELERRRLDLFEADSQCERHGVADEHPAHDARRRWRRRRFPRERGRRAGLGVRGLRGQPGGGDAGGHGDERRHDDERGRGCDDPDPPASQGAPADRQLDEVVGRRRETDGAREPDSEERRSLEARPSGGQSNVDRPVPEVQAVRDQADPADGSQRQEVAERAGRLGGHARDDHRDEERSQEETTAVEPRRVVRRPRPCPREQ